MRKIVTDELMLQLQEINWKWNNEILYKTDPERVGKSDYWEDAREIGEGDCDDYAISKMEALLEAGWEGECMGVATCWVDKEKQDGYHAVLLVNTDRGCYVLDNRFKSVMPWKDCNYEWHLIPPYIKTE